MDSRSAAGGRPKVLLCVEPIASLAVVARIRAKLDRAVMERGEGSELGAIFEWDVEVVGKGVAWGDPGVASLND